LKDPISKILNTHTWEKKKKAHGVDQVEECLRSKCETLTSNPNTAKELFKILMNVGQVVGAMENRRIILSADTFSIIYDRCLA
jgi:hypothetical protein